eukprot:318752_1
MKTKHHNNICLSIIETYVFTSSRLKTVHKYQNISQLCFVLLILPLRAFFVYFYPICQQIFPIQIIINVLWANRTAWVLKYFKHKKLRVGARSSSYRNYTLRALDGDKLKSEYHAVRRICFVNRNIFPDNMAHRLLFVVLEMEKKENMFEMNLINCCGFFVIVLSVQNVILIRRIHVMNG